MALRADDVDLGRDRDLVLCAQSGDDDAFEDLYRRYFARLYRFCLRRVGDPHEAEELTQEAFTRAYHALPRLDGERRFYPWLSVIASRLCVDAFRRRARSEPTPVIDLGVLEGGQEDVEDAGDIALLGRAMERLTPRHRHVLQLREQEGWSYQHIAEHYDVSLGTVEALLHRARRALRREFDTLAGSGRRAAGLPVLAWLARRADRMRSRVAGWEQALTPMVGNAVAAGVIVMGSALGGAAPAPVTVPMAPAAAVHEAPAPVPAPQAAPADQRQAPATQAAAEPASPPATTAAPAPQSDGSLVVGAAESRARAQEQPYQGQAGDTDTGWGLDPGRTLVQTAETIDHEIDEFERTP